MVIPQTTIIVVITCTISGLTMEILELMLGMNSKIM
jgi:hypothetical protein